MRKMLLSLVGALALSSCDSKADESNQSSCPLNAEEMGLPDSIEHMRYVIKESSIKVRYHGHTYYVGPISLYDGNGSGDLDEHEAERLYSVIKTLRVAR